MLTTDTYIGVVYRGQVNTPEGIRKAFEAGLISEGTMTELLNCANKKERDAA